VIEFTVPGLAIGKPRPRVTRRGTFMPPAYQAWRTAVAAEAMVACGLLEDQGRPWDASLAPFRVSLWFTFDDKRRRDVDNLAGGILDALNGVLWADDYLVCSLRVDKRHGSPAGARVRIEAVSSVDWEGVF
jgi:Holliday junction resolvase RusA-like endonuclease